MKACSRFLLTYHAEQALSLLKQGRFDERLSAERQFGAVPELLNAYSELQKSRYHCRSIVRERHYELNCSSDVPNDGRLAYYLDESGVLHVAGNWATRESGILP